MPELPEVESLRRSLEPGLVARRVVSVDLCRPDIIETHDASPPTPTGLLLDQRVETLARRGKQIAIVGDAGTLIVVHLGMSGQLLRRASRDASPRPTHTHVVWTLDDGSTLLFRDPRRFGGIWTFASRAALEATRWASLGPDALDATGESLFAAARGSARAIKALLLDQSVLAGVGNIYADEACFEAQVCPTRRARTLTRVECERLVESIRRVLSRAIMLGGSTLRDYTNADGERGSAQAEHRVYGRAGEPCRTCGRVLRGLRLAQRATVYCPACQPPRSGQALTH